MARLDERAEAVRRRPLRAFGVDPLPAVAGQPRRSIVPIKPEGTTAPLFLVPGQLGQIFHFKRLAERIRDDIPAYAFEARGVYGDAPPLDDLAEIAELYVAEMRDVQPHGPHLLGGFSVGATVAYEMARQLEREGDPPRLLIFDYGPDSGITRDRVGSRMRRTPLDHALRPYRAARFHWTNYWSLEGERRAAYRRERTEWEIRAWIRRLRMDPDGTIWLRLQPRRPQRRDQERLAGADAVRSALHVAERAWEWLDGGPFGGPITLFRAEVQDPHRRRGPALGFDERTAPGGLELQAIPGYHSFLFVEPHIFSLLVELEDWVDRKPMAGGTAGHLRLVEPLEAS